MTNVDKVIKIVLEKVADIECDRLQEAIFRKYILIRACGLAQLQITSDFGNCEYDDLVLQSDATSMKGHSYTTFKATVNEGNFFLFGYARSRYTSCPNLACPVQKVMSDISSFNKEDSYDRPFHRSKT